MGEKAHLKLVWDRRFEEPEQASQSRRLDELQFQNLQRIVQEKYSQRLHFLKFLVRLWLWISICAILLGVGWLLGR